MLLPGYQSDGVQVSGTVRLPLLLARGARTIRERVHDCLISLFSTAIHEISFPCEDMFWMIAAWSGFINEKKTNKDVAFLYEIPSKKDSIKCQYPVHFIKSLWNW